MASDEDEDPVSPGRRRVDSFALQALQGDEPMDLEAQAAEWAAHRKRARRMRQGVKMAEMIADHHFAADPLDALDRPHTADDLVRAQTVPAGRTRQDALTEAAELRASKSVSPRMPGSDAEERGSRLTGSNVQLDSRAHEVVEWILGEDWAAARELVQATTFRSIKELDRWLESRTQNTSAELQRLEQEIKSKLKMQCLQKRSSETLEGMLDDLLEHVQAVTQAVMRDQEDSADHHRMFLDDFASNHASDLHRLLVRVGKERDERTAARDKRVKEKKDQRIDKVAKMVGENLKVRIPELVDFNSNSFVIFVTRWRSGASSKRSSGPRRRRCRPGSLSSSSGWRRSMRRRGWLSRRSSRCSAARIVWRPRPNSVCRRCRRSSTGWSGWWRSTGGRRAGGDRPGPPMRPAARQATRRVTRRVTLRASRQAGRVVRGWRRGRGTPRGRSARRLRWKRSGRRLSKGRG